MKGAVAVQTDFVTTAEAAKTLGVSEKTVRRAVAKHGVATKKNSHRHESQRGAFTQLLIDLNDLVAALEEGKVQMDKRVLEHTELVNNECLTDGHVNVSHGHLDVHLNFTADTTAEIQQKDTQVQNVHLNKNVHLNVHLKESIVPYTQTPVFIPDASQISPEHLARGQQIASECAKLHEILLYTEHGQKEAAMERSAETLKISITQVRRYYASWRETKSAVALARKQRADAGKARIPAALLGLIETACVTNPTAVPARVRRLIHLVNPSALYYFPNLNSRKQQALSVSSIARIRERLLSDPIKSTAFLDGKGRKEFMRSYSGEVVAFAAGELWQADMTRCDCFVYDLETRSAVRLRIHALIDVFSGAIPSFVFSTEENQRQTDRMIVLSLMEKPGQWATRWNVYATPKRIYWDNGKTYKSEKSHNALEALGVEVIHSIPKVSHSRGKIERFFGTFHGTFEKLMQGYAGANAVQRDHDTIGRLTANTERWIDAGADPAKDPGRERLLLKDEYQAAALGWLCDDYHQNLTDGKSREQWFNDTCPAGQRVQYGFDDLKSVMSEQHERVVSSNGTVRFGNAIWGMRNAGLMRYQKQTIVLRVEDMLVDKVIKAFTTVGPNLMLIGTLELMNWSALSSEAREHRAAQREEGKQIKIATQAYAAQYTDPQYRADKIYMRGTELPEITKTLQLKAPKAKLELQPVDHEALELEAYVEARKAEGWVYDEEVELNP